MEGGPGNDIFEYLGSEFTGGEIKDFTKGEDRIQLTDLNVDAAQLARLLRNSSGNELDLGRLGAGFEDVGTITLNVDVSTLDASDFILS